MVLDELLLVLSSHCFEGVELALEVIVKVLASLDDCIHDFESLLLGNTWTKRVFSEVSSNSNSGRVYHFALLLGELVILQLLSVHVGYVFVLWAVLVVVLNDLIEQFVELSVGLVGSSINSNSRILIGNS